MSRCIVDREQCRGLQNAIERFVILSRNRTLELAALEIATGSLGSVSNTKVFFNSSFVISFLAGGQLLYIKSVFPGGCALPLVRRHE